MKRKKEKPLRITSDGLSKAIIHTGAYANKKIFDDHDDDDNDNTNNNNNNLSNAQATAQYQALKRKQLSYTLEEDIERDRQRVQMAHREKRLLDRENRQKETTKGVKLGNLDEDLEDEIDDDNKINNKNNKYSSDSSSDVNSDDSN